MTNQSSAPDRSKEMPTDSGKELVTLSKELILALLKSKLNITGPLCFVKISSSICNNGASFTTGFLYNYSFARMSADRIVQSRPSLAFCNSAEFIIFSFVIVFDKSIEITFVQITVGFTFLLIIHSR